MDMGMLWYDDDVKSTLDDKVRRAADYYQNKYGRCPNLCLINPKLVPSANGNGCKAIDSVELGTATNILLHHFWIGIARSGSKESGS